MKINRTQTNKALAAKAAGAFLFACSLLLSSFSPALAQEIQSEHCLHGCPSGSPANNMVIIREIYILSNNSASKFADWVAYKITAETIQSKGKTKRKWKADPLLAENETLEPEDYKDAHKVLKTDRGHQAPLPALEAPRIGKIRTTSPTSRRKRAS